jgi:hypothetical protein
MTGALLSHADGMLTPSAANPRLAAEVARAANDWTSERWLAADPRFRGLILVPNQTPELAAREIARVAAREPGMIGVLLAANGLSKPFGHPVYWPILEAAAEHGLTVVVHAGGDAVAESPAHTTAGGVPSTYAEYHAFAVQPIMTHLVSLIGQGTFEQLPELRVLISGVGAAWLPALFWRFDSEYRALRDHVRITTYPLERAADPAKVARLLAAFAGMEDLLLFASGYPSWDTDWPEEILDRIPAGWVDGVLRQNAARLFGADRLGDVPSSPGPAAA